MLNIINFTFYFTIIINTVNSQNIIKGKVVSGNTPLPYCSVLSTVNKSIGTITNLNGEFEIEINSENNQSFNLYVSALGFRDTLIHVNKNSFNKLYLINLVESPIQLEEVVIKPTRQNPGILGDASISLLANKNKFLTVRANQAGAGVGTVFNTQQRAGIIKSISVFVDVIQEEEYIISLYSLDQIGHNYKLYPKNLLRPIIAEPILFNANKTGWIKIDLENKNIYLPENNLAVIITQLKKSSLTLKRNMDIYDYNIGRQLLKKKGVHHLYIFGNRFSTFPSSDDVSAIFVTFWETSK